MPNHRLIFRATALVVLCCLFTTEVGPAAAKSSDSKPADAQEAKPAEAKLPAYLKKPYANPKDDPKLPNVLLLGDSISIGYTVPVRKLLDGKANVYRPQGNCCYSAYGVKNIEKWVGKRRWDVIHFNWGIWDTHMMDKDNQLVRGPNESKYAPGELTIRATPEQYAANLKKILATLESTGATLIWANTTPVMGRQGDRFEDIVRHNRAAATLMRQHDIPINDLYQLVLPHAADWQTQDQVHYTPQGYTHLAHQVADKINEALDQRKKSKGKPATLDMK
ncbi:MAG: SGNH/GDSL hydrolase family protein [Pirellulales bacterium]|nr:SGNH/GDSL hydrolase family protein [Pirellulales bacterium]